MFRVPVTFVLLLGLVLLSACSSRPAVNHSSLNQADDYYEEVLVNAQDLHLFTRTWQPVGDAKANIILLHATSMHGGIYEKPARQFAAAGYRVVALDMQGWGRSEGLKAPGYVQEFDDYGLDVKLLVQHLRRRYPDVKNYLMGESFGGTVAMYTAVKYGFLLDGVITSGVGYQPSMKVLGIRAPEFVNEFSRTSTKWLSAGFFSMPAVDSDMGLKVALEDEALEQRLMDDPYVAHGWLPATYLHTTLAAIDYIEPRLRQVSVPIILLHGRDDVLVPVASSQQIYDEVSSQKKYMKVYEGPHAVLLESHSAVAVKDVTTILDQLN